MDRKAVRAVRNDLHKTIKNVFSDTFLERRRRIFIIQNGIVLCAHWSGQTFHFHQRYSIYIIILYTVYWNAFGGKYHSRRIVGIFFCFVFCVLFFFTRNLVVEDLNESKSRVRHPSPSARRRREDELTIFHKRVSIIIFQTRRRRPRKSTRKFLW